MKLSFLLSAQIVFSFLFSDDCNSDYINLSKISPVRADSGIPVVFILWGETIVCQESPSVQPCDYKLSDMSDPVIKP